MTIKELVYNIRNQLKIARPDDLNISDRQIEFMINYLREKLIVQHLQKGRSISSIYKQDLGQVSIQKIDRGEGVLLSNTSVFRTTKKIPQPIELDQQDLFTYIGGIDKQSPFIYKTKANAKWNAYTKYSSKLPLAYYSNGYMYITNCSNQGLKWINIEGVFNNPREVSKFKTNGESCYNPDIDIYPISGRFIDMINELIKSKELNTFLQIAENNTNNSSDII